MNQISSSIGQRSYAYGENGFITNVVSNRGSIDYTYDQNNSIITSFYKGNNQIPNETFIWDGAGNNIQGAQFKTNAPITSGIDRSRPLIYNNALLEDATILTDDTYGVGEFAFSYYNTGNPVMKYNNNLKSSNHLFGENFLYEYDPEGRLVVAKKADMEQKLNQAVSFRYDGLGRRIEKEVIQKDGTTTRTHYVYNGDNIIFEYDITEKLVATYLGTAKIDDNLLMIRDGKDYYFHKDHLGSITDITDSVGNVVERIDYSVFGKILNVVDKDGVKTTPIKNPFYFTGREWDEEIGMYYYRARFYDPALGRFLTPDPIGLAGGDTNLYRYVFNNPMNFTDPTGLFVGPGISPEQFAQFANTQAGQSAIQNKFGSGSSQNFRYVQVGDQVIDMRHASAAFNTTNDLISSGVPSTIAGGITYGLGVVVEIDQATGGRLSNFSSTPTQPSYGQPGSSAFSSEDISSNMFGINAARRGSSLQNSCFGGGQ